MGDMLSQEEINALLGNSNLDSDSDGGLNASSDELLSNEQKDALGEIGNISMGTAATTLFALLNQKVNITTPKVNVLTWNDLSDSYDRPCVGIKVGYKEGLIGSNILVLKQTDVKIIANLMMGGDGVVDEDEELTELDLSAIAEAMNQMVGSSSTSLSSMLSQKIDIDTPQAFVLSFQDDSFFDKLDVQDDIIVCIAFKMEIGTLIDSEIMQILPLDFAKDMVNQMLGIGTSDSTDTAAPVSEPEPSPAPAPAPVQQPDPMQYQQPMPQQQMAYQQQPMPQQQMAYQQPMPQQQMAYQQPMPMPQQQPVNVQPVQFQNFDVSSVMQQKENIGIIMDVPLEITVELGRTHKLIKEILEFSPGTVIELDKLAGEPIDILVNGKFIAKGEVVVIDENFGIRITDIINAEDRI